jgi:hypothetical protein
MAENLHTKIEVAVHYIAATKPYKVDAESTETVGTLKANALNFFGLKEEGNKTYKLFYEKKELDNPNETVGQVAGDKKAIKLDLEEFITQGK